jgi:predicted house-cleaning noncanonical NTP pyrophosphatase (MazG superfamily)
MVGEIGRKAEGLAVLPPAWVPPYFVIDRDLILSFLDPVEGVRDWLREGAGATQLASLQRVASDGLIVRSSGVTETLGDRGLYESRRCDPSPDGVADAAAEIWKDAGDVVGTRVDELPLLIQTYVAPVIAGHLSNERRVQRRSRDWLCEISVPAGAARSRYRLRVSADTTLPVPQLACTDAGLIEDCLGHVAARLLGGARRYHCEWLWDGERVWIVQADWEAPKRAPAPGSFCPNAPAIALPGSFATWRELHESDVSSPKLRCLAAFRECGLSIPRFLLLEGEHVVAELARGHVPDDLRTDLRVLADHNLVVRTDVVSAQRSAELMLPRTDVCLTSDALAEFLVGSSRHLIKKGVAAKDVIFLAHRFLAARASAWSLATPQHARVHIDSTWGLPDGLMYYPHDSFEVDAASGDILSKRIRCKEVYLDSRPNGEWSARSAGTGLDWKQSLTPVAAAEIARQSKLIAQHLETPVEIMFFVDLIHEPDLGSVLPWFFSQELAREAAPGKTDAHFAHEPMYVTDNRSVGAVATAFRLQRLRPVSALRIRPTEDALRSTDFVSAVADLAKTLKCPVELEGSLLAHFYYELARADVPVRAVDLLETVERRRSFSKLVRDLIPVRIEGHGEVASTQRATRAEMIPLLKAKAVEEALELLATIGPDQATEEMADLVEVLRAFCQLTGIELNHVFEVAEAKRDERGGFETGTVLLETRESSVTESLGTVDRLFPGGATIDRRDALGRRRPTEAYPRPRWIPNRLTLPLIPPELGRYRELTVMLPSGDRLTARYEDKEILVDILSTRRKRLHPGQMELSLDDH